MCHTGHLLEVEVRVFWLYLSANLSHLISDVEKQLEYCLLELY